MQTDYPLDRRVGPEAKKSYREKVKSGFLAKYLSGPCVLDIGHKGADAEAETIVPHAIGVGMDYPGYDGLRLPFPNDSQDAVYSSHCLEHIPNSNAALAEWYRVLRLGGYIVLAVPHQWLYERKATVPAHSTAPINASTHPRHCWPRLRMRCLLEAIVCGCCATTM